MSASKTEAGRKRRIPPIEGQVRDQRVVISITSRKLLVVGNLRIYLNSQREGGVAYQTELVRGR